MTMRARWVTWWIGGAVLVLVAVALTRWAATRPSFDAYGWLTWGEMTVRGHLDTNAAPSFKPLPYAFTVVYALLGSAQMRLWLVTATAVSLGGLVFAGRLGWWLAVGPGHPVRWRARTAGAVAAVLAVAGVLALHDEFPYGFLHYALSAQSDPMVVALLLAAIDCAARGRARWTFWLLVLASLGRPEVWPFLIADGVWLWRSRPGMRAAVLAGLAGVALLWFGVPALSSRSWLVAADNADASGFGPRHDRALGVLSRFVIQPPWPLGVAAGVGVALGARRRDRLVVSLAGCVVAWMAIEVAFGLHGWPALGRYMFEASAVVAVLGAGAVGRLLAWDGRGAVSARAALAGLLAAAVVAGTVPVLVTQGRAAQRDLVAQRARTRSLTALGSLVHELGGPARVRSCGESISRGLAGQTVLAYLVVRNVSAVGYRFPQPGHATDPVVVFSPLRGGGWSARALRQTSARCEELQRRGAVVVR